MTIEARSPEAFAILRSLVNEPHAIEDSPVLQLLFVDKLVMGSPAKVHITPAGGRLLAAKIAAENPF